jgi:hypothetical protein
MERFPWHRSYLLPFLFSCQEQQGNDTHTTDDFKFLNTASIQESLFQTLSDSVPTRQCRFVETGDAVAQPEKKARSPKTTTTATSWRAAFRTDNFYNFQFLGGN